MEEVAGSWQELPAMKFSKSDPTTRLASTAPRAYPKLFQYSFMDISVRTLQVFGPTDKQSVVAIEFAKWLHK